MAHLIGRNPLRIFESGGRPASSGPFYLVTHDGTVLHSAQDDIFIANKAVADELYVDTA
jgi:hypothetical protein